MNIFLPRVWEKGAHMKVRVSIQGEADAHDVVGATSVTKDHRGGLWREKLGTTELDLTPEQVLDLQAKIMDLVSKL